MLGSPTSIFYTSNDGTTRVSMMELLHKYIPDPGAWHARHLFLVLSYTISLSCFFGYLLACCLIISIGLVSAIPVIYASASQRLGPCEKGPRDQPNAVCNADACRSITHLHAARRCLCDLSLDITSNIGSRCYDTATPETPVMQYACHKNLEATQSTQSHPSSFSAHFTAANTSSTIAFGLYLGSMPVR